MHQPRVCFVGGLTIKHQLFPLPHILGLRRVFDEFYQSCPALEAEVDSKGQATVRSLKGTGINRLSFWIPA